MPIKKEAFIIHIESKNSSLYGFSCFTQNPNQSTNGIINKSIKINIIFLSFGFIFATNLTILSFEKFFKEIVFYNPNYILLSNLVHYLYCFAINLSKYNNIKLSTTITNEKSSKLSFSKIKKLIVHIRI